MEWGEGNYLFFFKELNYLFKKVDNSFRLLNIITPGSSLQFYS